MSDEQHDPQAPADAVLVPKAMAGPGDHRTRMGRVAALARPLMGLGPNDAVNLPTGGIGDCFLVRKGAHDNADSFLFPIDHDRAGETRHDWTARDDGVQLGRLKPDPPQG